MSASGCRLSNRSLTEGQVRSSVMDGRSNCIADEVWGCIGCSDRSQSPGWPPSSRSEC
jgi:hypothetical protein